MVIPYKFRSERRIAQYTIKTKVFPRETVWYHQGERELFDVLTAKVCKIVLPIEEAIDLTRVSRITIAQDYVDIQFVLVQPDNKVFEKISEILSHLVELSATSA